MRLRRDFPEPLEKVESEGQVRPCSCSWIPRKHASWLFGPVCLQFLGFAVFGLIMGPDHRIGLERRSEVEVEIRRPQVPDLEEFVQVWHGAGYDLFKREQNCQLQPAGQAAEPWAWIQCREQWVLVPREPGLDLTGFLFQLCSAFWRRAGRCSWKPRSMVILWGSGAMCRKFPAGFGPGVAAGRAQSPQLPGACRRFGSGSG